MKENRVFHNNKLLRIQRDFGDVGVFIAGGVAALARRDKDPSMLDLKSIPIVFDHIVEMLLGAHAPGAHEPSDQNGAPEPGAHAPSTKEDGAHAPQERAIDCTSLYNGAHEPGAHAPSIPTREDLLGVAYRTAIHEVTQELGIIERPETMTDEEALEYLSRKKEFARKVRVRASELCSAVWSGAHAQSAKVQEKVPLTLPLKEQIKEFSGKGGMGENPKLLVDIPDEPVLQVTAIDKTSPADMIPPHQLREPFTKKNSIRVECPKELKEISDNGSIPENFAAYYLSKFPGKLDAVEEFEKFVSWHLSKGTKYKEFYRCWITWVLNKKNGFKKDRR